MGPQNTTINITTCNINGTLAIINLNSTLHNNPLRLGVHNNMLELQDQIQPLCRVDLTMNGISTTDLVIRNMAATAEGTLLEFTPTYTRVEIMQLQITMNQTALMTRGSSLIDLIYPVGSVYISATSTVNPATLFGRGTWSRIQQGLMWITPGNDGNTAFQTNASAVHTGGGSFPGFRVYVFRRTE
jgi:hypothetical protein